MTFPPEATAPIVLPGDGSSVASVVAADVNGDGHADVMATSNADGVHVLLGDGRGALAAPRSFDAPDVPVSLDAGDLTGDGRPDLVVGTNGGVSIHVLVGDGAGGFTRQTLTAECVGFGDPVAADVLGDARAEIVVRRRCGDATPELRVYTVDAAGGTTLAQSLADRDAGLGRSATPSDDRVATGDLTGDGRSDVVAMRDGRRLQVFAGGKAGLRQVSSTVYANRGAPRDLGLGDVDGDGRLDAFVLIPGCGGEGPVVCPGLVLLRGDGRGGLRSPTAAPYPVGEESYRVASGDLTGDGLTDVVTPSLTDPGRIIGGSARGFAFDGEDIRGTDAVVTDLGAGVEPEIVTVGWVGDHPLDHRAAVRVWRSRTVRSGAARISAPSGCVRGARARVVVRGRGVRRVTMEGLGVQLVARRGGDSVWRFDLAARRLARRGTTLRVAASFAALQPPRVFTLRLRRCS